MNEDVFVDIMKTIFPKLKNNEEFVNTVKDNVRRFEEFAKEAYEEGNKVDISVINAYSVASLALKGVPLNVLVDIILKIYILLNQDNESDLLDACSRIMAVMNVRGFNLQKILDDFMVE